MKRTIWKFPSLVGVCLAFLLALSEKGTTKEYHVSSGGDDAQPGSSAKMLKTISEAARRAKPGDVVTVHAGVYRERIDPPRGGESDKNRIVYRAAAGAGVAIKGSEVVKDWSKVGHDTWTASLPNRLFGAFNPYNDLIKGDWFTPGDRQHHTGAVYLNGHWLTEAATKDEVLAAIGETPLWFGEVDEQVTTIWAQFQDADPNTETVEINVRQSVFYPSRTGRDYITVRGFTLEHAATPWAPPTAEQIGLIGTNWSKGWIIENNTIQYSTCSGVTLGKHGDEFDNTSEDSATGYVDTIKRGLAQGWNKERIGSHVVRDNHISHCEQAGIVGSLGPIFCTITGNEIHDIHVRRLFTGAEMAGIKFHAPINTLISGNHIYRTDRGIWLDWMSQGTRVTRNILHDNHQHDLFMEVNHGPFLVDHNLLLSETASLRDWSEGGAYAHNLFVGKFEWKQVLGRETPWQEEHGTLIAGLKNIEGGDNRFYNNLFIGESGLSIYDQSVFPDQMGGNVFLHGAKPSKNEKDALVLPDFNPGIILRKENWVLEIGESFDAGPARQIVTSELLGKSTVTKLRYLLPDGSAIHLDTDMLGAPRNVKSPYAGPFTASSFSRKNLQVWPLSKGDMTDR